MRKAHLLAALGLAGVVSLSPSVAAAGPTETLHINEIQANPGPRTQRVSTSS